MVNTPDQVTPLPAAGQSVRQRLDIRGELALACLPTLTVLGMLVLRETFSQQRLLFASLASSAFLIYLDPHHGTNQIRRLVVGHLAAATLGLVTFLLLGHGYLAAGSAMVVTIVVMIIADVVHPPAVSTSLIFALRTGAENEFVLFALALAVIALLVLVQRTAVWLITRMMPR